jgi:hypothetical protein
MCPFYIDIVIVSVDIDTIRCFGDCCIAAMAPERDLGYSHRQMFRVVPWPTSFMLFLVVFVVLANSMCP